jgi:DNA-binding NtrC family response regulator
MPDQLLRGCRILVVEDEFFLAEDLQQELSTAGATVVGMASTIREALALIDTEGHLDCAILDVNLGGKPVFPVADYLIDRSVPFVLTTGYDASSIPPRYQGALRCEKPFHVPVLIHSIRQAINK